MGSSWSQEEAAVSGGGIHHNNIQEQAPASKSNVNNSEGAATQITNTAVVLQKKPFPHNYENILKHIETAVDRSSPDKLYDHLSVGVYLNHKRQKYWVDMNVRNCFMLFAQDLLITWAEDSRFWHWPLMHESGVVSLPVAELLNVCWLEVHGKFDTTNCSPGTIYEVVFVVMLKDHAYGLEVPINLRLILPDGTKQESTHNLIENQRGRWIDIQVGEFTTSLIKTGVLEFSLYEYEGGKWKKGVVIKGVVIRPKS